MRMLTVPLLALLLAVPASAQAPDVTPLDRQIHDELLVLDTHLDIPMRFEGGDWDFGEHHHFHRDRTQVDLPRMEQGGLDGGFFVIYTGQGELTPQGYAEARSQALVRAAAIHRVLGENRERMGLALTAEDIQRLHREGKSIALLSIENSWPLGEDLSLLGSFHRLGVRMAGPVHNGNNQFSDSATAERPRWNGLSPLGRAWVAEMNRLGMLIDASHASDAAFDQMLALSKTPIILSHSGPRAMYEHPRNLDDARMRRLAQAGGVMFLNSLFLAPDDRSPERRALQGRQRQWQSLTPAERRQLLTDLETRERQQTWTAATFDSYMRSLLHAVRVMGADHVGLGADWDGGGGVQGLEDVSLLPRITARLRREGLSEPDIAKIMGGNLLRVMRQAQAQAQAGRS